MSDSRLTLYLPDLAASIRATPVTPLPVLAKLLTRAAGRPLDDGAQWLAGHFGLQEEALAVAPIERFGITGLRDRSCWWRADPVHLLVDRDQVAMLPRRVLAVSTEEAQALAASFNAMYAADGLRMEATQPDAWYLQVPAAWHCRTWDPARVEGWAITEFMPAGADEAALRKLMNEIQMLFYEHPVNQARERNGKPVINSLWLWGGGTLPEKVDRVPARVISNLPLIRGLAQLGERDCESWPARPAFRCGAQEVFIGCTLSDFSGNSARVDAELLQPCWRALMRGRVQALELFPGGSRTYALTRGQALRFWRRSRTPLSVLEETDVAAAD